MDSKEALDKINEIHNVIESSNKALFSGDRMITIGVLVCLIPLIEMGTHHLTFGHDFGENGGLIISLIHTAFYWILFSSIGKWRKNGKKENQDQQHPLIKKAFGLGRPFVVCIIGLVIVLSMVGQYQLIHSVTLILLGLLFNLYGRFTIPAVTYISWSYILIGLIYAALSNQHFHNLWIAVLLYNGISYIVMGYLLKKEQRAV